MPTPQKPRPRRDLLRIGPAADYLGVGERYMRRLVSNRSIRHYKVGQFVMFDRADLDAYVDAGLREAVR